MISVLIALHCKILSGKLPLLCLRVLTMLRLIYWKTTVVTVFLASYPEVFNKFYASYETTQTSTLYVPGDL